MDKRWKNKECEKTNNLSCKDERRDKKQTNTMKKGMTHESKKKESRQKGKQSFQEARQ